MPLITIRLRARILHRRNHHIASAVIILSAASIGDLDLASAIGWDIPVAGQGYDLRVVLV